MNKELFSNSSTGTKLFFLFFFSFLGFIFTAILVSFLNTFFIPTQGLYPSSYYRLAQIIQAICLFILPSIFYIYLFIPDKTNRYFKTNKISFKIVIISILLIIAAIPCSDFLAEVNKQLPFPQSIDKLIQAMEDNSDKIVSSLLADKTPKGIILNYLIIAAVAAIAEELFFRGCLLQIINTGTKNKHIAIWISALIFSAIHFEFYGFLPRTLLGALLGYIFIWTANIIIPIIVHFTYNSLIITFEIFVKNTRYYNLFNEFCINYKYVLIAASLLSIILLICSLRKYYKINSLQQ